MDNNEVAAEFAAWMRLKRDAPYGTVEKYQRLTLAWASWLDSGLADRTPADVEAFTARPRRTGRPAANATVRNEQAVIASLYRWGEARLGWSHNPAVLAGRPKVHNVQPRPVEDDLWLSVWTHESLRTDARVALGLGYFAGLRREELIRLRVGQVWGNALVNFTRKNGGEDRMDIGDLLDHWQATMPHLEAHRLAAPLRELALQERDGLLLPWGTGVRPTGLNKRMRHWLGRCGVPSDAFTPHQLRHSFATNLVKSGVPLALVASLCNHGSPTVTMRYVKAGTGQLAALRAPIVEVAR